MEAKHTPGPWIYDEVWSLVTGPKGEPQQVCAIHGSNLVPPAQAKANARLIAAAPDLLEALKMALYELEEKADRPNAKRYTAEHARAAIAKATGH